MSDGPVNLETLEQLKRQSLGQLLFKCARLFNERAIERVNRGAGQPTLRPSHTNLFPHLDFKGTRLTDLARKLGVSKQAVGQTVADLEQMGVVESVADPTDARAKLVRFTKRGGESIAYGLQVLNTIEQELTPSVGQAHMLALHEALLALEAALLLPETTVAVSDQPQATVAT
jgi:DNA-binding MarR family transcriptional regulator